MPSLLFLDGREHGWIATIFKRPFPIPLQLVVPQVLARMRLDEWHEEFARYIAQALQCTIRTGGLPCIEMIRRRPVRSQQNTTLYQQPDNEEGTGKLVGVRLRIVRLEFQTVALRRHPTLPGPAAPIVCVCTSRAVSTRMRVSDIRRSPRTSPGIGGRHFLRYRAVHEFGADF